MTLREVVFPKSRGVHPNDWFHHHKGVVLSPLKGVTKPPGVVLSPCRDSATGWGIGSEWRRSLGSLSHLCRDMQLIVAEY